MKRKPKAVEESKELAPIERAAQVLKFDDRRAELVQLAEGSKRIVEIRDQVSRDECHGARMQLKTARVAIERIGKTAREDATAFAKAVIRKEDELIAVILPEEHRLQALQSTWDDAREAEKTAAREAEEARIRAENAILDTLRNLPANMVGKSSAEIAQTIVQLTDTDLAPSFHPSGGANIADIDYARAYVASAETAAQDDSDAA